MSPPPMKNPAAPTCGNRPARSCEYCYRALPQRKRGKAGRRPRFCSGACRTASFRDEAAFEAAGYSPSRCNEIGSKRAEESTCYEPHHRHPHPPCFSVPLVILGRGHRWPSAPKLDAATRDKIVWREIGRKP